MSQQISLPINYDEFVYFPLQQSACLIGDEQSGVLRIGLEPRLRSASQGATISTDIGLLVLYEFDETPMKKLTLKIERSSSQAHGDQEGSAYNAHSGCDCYHLLFVFNLHEDFH